MSNTQKNLIKKIINRLNEWINADWLFSIRAYQELKYNKTDWEEQYTNGYWEMLQNIREFGHYSIIAGYYQFRNKPRHILDIGCGEGLLQKYLKVHTYSTYLGIDLSEIAIQKAQTLSDNNTQFIQADAETFKPEQKFGCIIFNECLYYFKDPVAVIQHYEQYLQPDGDIIISMFYTRRSKRIWQALEKKGYHFADGISISNQQNTTWKIKLISKT